MTIENREYPIKLTLTIEPGSMKRIVEEGRLMEFVDALSSLASAHIKAQVIDQVARGAIAQGDALSMVVGFDDGERYGTGPKPWPWPRGIWEDALREVALQELATQMRGG